MVSIIVLLYAFAGVITASVCLGSCAFVMSSLEGIIWFILIVLFWPLVIGAYVIDRLCEICS